MSNFSSRRSCGGHRKDYRCEEDRGHFAGCSIRCYFKKLGAIGIFFKAFPIYCDYLAHIGEEHNLISRVVDPLPSRLFLRTRTRARTRTLRGRPAPNPFRIEMARRRRCMKQFKGRFRFIVVFAFYSIRGTGHDGVA
jgi:hypothetical protein